MRRALHPCQGSGTHGFEAYPTGDGLHSAVRGPLPYGHGTADEAGKFRENFDQQEETQPGWEAHCRVEATVHQDLRGQRQRATEWWTVWYVEPKLWGGAEAAWGRGCQSAAGDWGTGETEREYWKVHPDGAEVCVYWDARPLRPPGAGPSNLCGGSGQVQR